MDRDLQSRPPRDDWYEWSLTAFYISYIGFEWMSLLWRVIPAHIYVSLLVLSWGLTASLQAVAPSYPFLIFLRTVLGIGEAGFTGIPFYLSFFYRREELALRTAMFISAAPLATSFASSLAYLIIRVGTAARIPIAPWRLLFLVEGFPSVLAAAAAWIIIPDSPRKARYLTRRERRVAKLRLRHQVAGPQPPPASAHRRPIQAGRVLKSYFSGSLVRSLRVLGDPFAWTTAIMLFLANVAYSSLPVFLPTILTSAMHLSSLHAQALAAPPYLIAFVVVLATAFWSDRARARAPFIVAHALLSAAGYAILALASTLRIPLWLRYAAVFPAASGFFAVVVLVISWNVNNIGVAGAARDAERLSSRTETGRREADSAAGTEKGLGFALLQLVGQCGPLVGTHLYPEADASSGYEKGMAVCCAAMLLVALLAVVGRALLVRRNTRLRSLEGEDDVDGDEAAGLVAGGRSRASDTRRGYGFTYIV